MPNAMTTAALTLLALAGAIVGVDLGRSTIAMINPAYYSSPPPGHYYAELTPQGYRPGGSGIESDLTPTVPLDPSRPDCLDCTTTGSGGGDREEFGAGEETWQPSEPVPLVIRGIPQGDLDRYMNYPVTQDEARHQTGKKPERYVSRESDDSGENDTEPEPAGM